MRSVLGAIRQEAISAVHRRDFQLPDAEPTVSFTFDDFPRSALLVGGAILKSYGACGTYYASMGLMNQCNALGEHFCAEDLDTLLKDGHELGSHTFSHLSCRSTPDAEFQADVARGKQAVEQVTGVAGPQSFSYPYGHATMRAKRRVGKEFLSCRGIVPGVNASPVDLNLVRANHLYSGSFDLIAIERLFDENERRRGWLIFYTHDVSERPSAFGCTPRDFESVVKIAAAARARCVPMNALLLERPT